MSANTIKNNYDQLKELAANLALNYYDVSLRDPSNEDYNPNIESIFCRDEVSNKRKTGEIRWHRNILIIGAGASKSAWDHINVGDSAKKLIIKEFEKKYREAYKLFEEELERLTNIYRLEKDDFETNLLAISKFSRNFILTELVNHYSRLYPASLFYEIVAHMFKHRFIDVIINFNFDEILDEAIKDELNDCDFEYIYSDGHCPDADIISHNDSLKETTTFDKSLLVAKRMKKPVYIKPHGTISHPSTLRFTREDYFNIPEKINNLIQYLLTAKIKDQGRLYVNLIVCGFEMASFEFNNLIKKSFGGFEHLLQIFYVNVKTSEKVKLKEKLDEKLSSKLRIHDITLSKEFTINNFSELLWEKLVMPLFSENYRPKSILRHKIIFELFSFDSDSENPIFKKNHPNFYNYIHDRIIIELILEILCSNGILNHTMINESRIKKFFSIYKESSGETVTINKLIEQLGLVRYRGFIKDTYYLNISGNEVFSRKKWAQHLIKKCISDDILKVQELRTRINKMEIQKLFNEFAESKLKLNISPKFFEKNISVFQKIDDEDLINTELKWQYRLNQFLINSEWNVYLTTTDRGGFFVNDYYANTLAGKLILPILSEYQINESTEKHFSHLEYLKKILIKNDNGNFFKIPWRSNNLHMHLFLNIKFEEPFNAARSFEVLGGLIYNRRLLSRRINPYLIDKTDDKITLFEMFLNYLDRSINQNNASQKGVNELSENLFNICKSHYIKTNKF